MDTLESLIKFDRENYKTANYDLLIGVDEVGRGAFAGPVVVSAFSSANFYSKRSVLPENLSYLNDSKKVRKSQREALVSSLKDDLRSAYYALAEKSAAYIDEHGIVIAIFEAMKESIVKVLELYEYEQKKKVKSLLVLVDGIKTIPGLDKFLGLAGYKIKLEQIAVKHGDAHSATIAAASNIAKDYRDKLMKSLIKDNPGLGIYFWHTNVGYGSKKHREDIAEYGLTEYHRRSFCRAYQA